VAPLAGGRNYPRCVRPVVRGGRLPEPGDPAVDDEYVAAELAGVLDRAA
jgi:hypothetical protein